MHNTLSIGATGQVVTRLQQFLNMHGFVQPITGYFGPTTRANLISYQKTIPACIAYGQYGTADEALITLVTAPDKLDAWCLAIKSREGFYAPGENPAYPAGTPAWRNNNPGNMKWSHQNNAVQSGPFAKFDTYQDGYNELKNLLIWACTGQARLYNKNGTLIDFYKIYAPSSDGNDPNSYAEEVAEKLAVQTTTIIKTLLI